jgi:hypothetical protein
MHWIIQENLINPATRDELLRVLNERNCSVVLAKLVPVFDVLMHEVSVPAGPVFVYGSTGLGNVAKSAGWAPGYYDAQLDYQLMLDRYGELALNYGAVCCPLGELPPQPAPFFVRPVLDNKSFAGTNMESWEEFEEFRAGIARIADDPEAKLRLTDVIAAAPLTRIDAEYRFFVINGRVVTGSRYKVGDMVRSSSSVPADVAQFAQQCVDVWAPNEAFTVDIAVTPGGLRVLELNSANSAGFYACDMGNIVDAVEAMLAPA